ncbi:CHAP domain-containing protein [Brevibacterium sp. CT2-23B]|uniref:CHAP domain-containing protein n=1 Tax=Brevibacterium sp. CT2-23B TaxID=2729630 RepID=UPI001553AD9A|nr:CHAP domain-containing protein [Brevibacterium sp. CT2-23B]
MATPSQLVAKATSKVGTTEIGYTNKVEFNDWFYVGRSKYGSWAAWCAAFTSWACAQIGMKANIDYPRTAGVAIARSWAQQRGRWVSPSNIKKGDLVVFLPHFSHIAIARADASGGSVKTVEGNTSPGSSGSQRDGGGVWNRTRPLSLVGGGIRLNFTSTETTTPSKPTEPEGILGMSVTNAGFRNKDVPLPKGKWKSIPIDDAGGYSLGILANGTSFIADTELTFKGLNPGAAVIGRFYLVSYKKGTPTRRLKGGTYPAKEIVGTAGTSLGSVMQMAKSSRTPDKGRSIRLRFEVFAGTKGVTFTKASHRFAKD